MTAPHHSKPYSTRTQRKRLFWLYQKAYYNAHKHLSTKQRETTYFQLNSSENILGYITPDFELYATFSTSIEKDSMLQGAKKIALWIQLNEKDLFILSPTTF